MRSGVTIVAVEQQKVLSTIFVCLYSSHSYLACIAHARYYVTICALSAVPHSSALSHKRYDFEQKKSY